METITISNGLRCTILEGNPINTTRYNQSFHVSIIGDFITSGDTISFEPYPRTSPNNLTGQVITVSDRIQDTFTSPHPYLKMDNREGSYFKVQLFLDENYDVIDNLRIPCASLLTSSLEIGEKMMTNLFIWISFAQIKETIFLLHENDCVKQKYGPVYRRLNTYFIRYLAILRANCFSSGFTLMSKNIYRPFGPYTGHNSRVVTTTERRCVTLFRTWKSGDLLLSKSSHLSYATRSVEEPMDRDMWFYLQSRIHHSVDLNIQIVNSPRRISLCNLSVGTSYVSIRNETLTITSGEGFASLRETICHHFGIRPKKKQPSGADVNNNLRNPFVLQQYEYINLLDIAMDPMDIDEDAMEVDVDAPSRLFSFVKLKYNYRDSTCTTTIRSRHCLTSQVNDRIQSFINDSDGQQDNHGNQLQVGLIVSRDDIEWVIVHVNYELDQVLMHDEDNANREVTWTVEEVLASIAMQYE